MSHKQKQITAARRHRASTILSLCLSCVFLFTGVLLPNVGHAQQLTGTIGATVYDQSGAVVPGADVTLMNSGTGDVRRTVSNATGSFSFTAVQPGTYNLSINAKGFRPWELDGIAMSQGDNRTVPNVSLKVGNSTAQVEVSTAGSSVPLDTGEISTTLNEHSIEDFPLVGRDAAALMEVFPGVAIAQSKQGTGFSESPVGSNQGPIGDFSVNGTQPNGPVALLLDGANLVDPGNAGTQIANTNQDMVSEIKFLSAGYDAEYAKGPAILMAYSKSGTQSFHGQAYMYARNSTFDSIESYAKSQITGDIQNLENLGESPSQARKSALKSASPSEHFYYYGGSLGGPVLLPFSRFNRAQKKLVFWFGYEYMNQQPAGAPINYNVPTLAQRSGDFSNSGVPAQVISTWSAAYTAPTSNLPAGATSTSIPQSTWDPNIINVLNLYPKPNLTPSALNGWNNFQYVSQVPQNRWEADVKIDYSITDNTKLSGSYIRQDEKDEHPIAIWWAPPWTLPYPSPVVAPTTSQEVMANLTHIFSPTTTNEVVFTLARYLNPNTLSNPSAVDRGKLGFNVPGLFGHTTHQIPNFIPGWGGAFPEIDEFSFDGAGFGGAFGGLKEYPAIYDNFTKVIGSHTTKFGFYWDTEANKGSNTNADNGSINFGGGQYSTGNEVADFLLGHVNYYQQASSIPLQDIKFHQWSLYGQDSYKMTKQMTINYGLRFDHIGQWYGNPGGMQVWDQASYVNATPNQAPANTGLLWNGINKKIPDSGYVSPMFYYSPRLGLAYDVFGTGSTVLRAGLGWFRYQVSTEVCSACGGPLGAFNYSTTAYQGYANVAQFTPPGSTEQNGSSVYALQQGDSRIPQTMDWDIAISQALPWHSVLQVAYVGDKSSNLYVDGSNGKLNDINNVRPGSIFLPDPLTGSLVSPAAPSCSSSNPSIYCQQNPGIYKQNYNANDFRPMKAYQDIYLLRHDSYANYNSLQVSWQKSGGPITFTTNYTFSKAMGIWDWTSNNGYSSGQTVDPFSLHNNYGPLAYDHSQILNFVYNWRLPDFVRHSTLLGELTNGWQISGYTAYQSGAPLQPNTGALNVTWPGNLSVPTQNNPNTPDNSLLLPNGLHSVSVNPDSWFGSNAYHAVLPVVTCNPTAHRHSGQYFNPSCFAPPAYGQQGTLQQPYIHLPAYADSDLGLYKTFHIHEHQNVQFRVTATNFINHPLRQFGLAGNGDETLNFTGTDANGNQFLSQTNTNTTTTGKPGFTTGQRQVMFAVKYLF